MLHANFQDRRASSSGEDFCRFLLYMGLAAVFGHVTYTINTKFRASFSWRLLVKFGFDWSDGFRDI